MNTFKKTLIATAVSFAAGSVQALPVFTDGNNAIGFFGYENQYRSADACAAGGCLAFDATNDPTGWQRVDPTIAGNVQFGDVFAGIFRAREIIGNTGDVVWESASNNQFTGYFAQQVSGVDASDINNVQLFLSAPTVDPFGLLTGSQMMKLFTDTTTTFTTAGTTFSSLARATDGSLWAALSAKDGYAYTMDDFTIAGSGSEFVAKNYGAYNIETYGPSYNAGELNLINDASESFVGGDSAGSLLDPTNILCSAADISNGVICTQFAGQSDVRRNSTTGPWYYIANDPLWMNRVPEPGSLALLGIGLFGLASLRRRKS